MRKNISIRHAVKKYGDNVIIPDLNLFVKEGEFFTLLGPSGCGKTTLLRMIAGFNSIEGGDFYFNDTRINDIDPAKRNIGMVFQNYAIFPNMTVRKNVEFGLKNRKLPKDEVRTQAEKFMCLMHVDEYADRLPERLSGGQQQRVALARALAIKPDVLLMDEPLSNLDAKLRVEMRTVIKEIQNKVGITTVYVTHDQEEAMAVSDRIAVMNHGRALQIGTPYEIYEAPATEFVARFIGETNIFDCTVLSSEKAGDEYMVYVDVPELDAKVWVTDYDDMPIGAELKFTIRPEKIQIVLTDEAVATKDDHRNVFHGIVEEPVYSGFQSKFYVKLQNGTIIKTFKQHTTYLDDGPEIEWKDNVTVAWRAVDGYLVKEKD